MPLGPSLVPSSTLHPVCLLTSDIGHAKYIYLLYHLGHPSSGSMSSETKVLLRLSWILTWERHPGLWGCLPYTAMVIGGESGDTGERIKMFILVLGAFTSSRQSL